MRKRQEYSRKIESLVWVFEHQSKKLTIEERWQKIIECKDFEISEEEQEILKEKLGLKI